MSENNGAVETGFNGKILVVDLSSGSISVENVAENLYREYNDFFIKNVRFLHPNWTFLCTWSAFFLYYF